MKNGKRNYNLILGGVITGFMLLFVLIGMVYTPYDPDAMDTSLKFYETLGGVVTDQADVKKATGTNHIKLVQMPGFVLEIIEPHDGSPVTAEGGLFPHIAIEVDDVDAAVADIKAAGIDTFRTPEPNSMPIFGGIRNIFLFGPDGELLELLQHL